MTPTRLPALALAATAVAAPFIPIWAGVLAAAAIVTATVVDALSVRHAPLLQRQAPAAVVRGRPSRLQLATGEPVRSRVRVRQPFGPGLRIVPSEAESTLVADMTGRRRGRHALPAPVARVRGPLGLGAWTHHGGDEGEVLVYPDLPGARRLAASIRQGRFRDEGRRTRGPIGLGTDFETLREYSPDDDIRQVNWLATARLGRPISNQFRVERDRDVICLVDCGRLTAAPIGDATRLDIALDAAVAVAVVAEELGDRCGAIAFDAQLRASVLPRHAGARAVVDALFDLEPVAVDSDYDRAFHEITRRKRAFVVVFTDLIEPTAAEPLVAALPVLAKHHSVAVASIVDPDLRLLAGAEPDSVGDVYRAAVAIEVLDARAAVIAQLRHAGSDVVEATPQRLPAACVSAYLRAKARARV